MLAASAAALLLVLSPDGSAATDDRCVYGKNQDFVPIPGSPSSPSKKLAGPDECCAACASDPDCVVANYDPSDSLCWLKRKGYTTQPNAMDKGGVDSLYLCRRTGMDDPSLLATNAAGGCLPQAHGWTFVFATLGIVSLYVVGGTLYSVKGPRQLPLGVQALPHLEFWREFSSLVQDGVSWTVAQAGGKGGSLEERLAAPPGDTDESGDGKEESSTQTKTKKGKSKRTVADEEDGGGAE